MKALNIFEMSSHLLGLHAEGFQTHVEKANNKGKSQADWIVGIKNFTDTASVHGDYWEKHPKGDETLVLFSGTVRLTASDNEFVVQQTHELNAGEAVVIPVNTWHRIEVIEAGQLMFLTPALGSKIEKVEKA